MQHDVDVGLGMEVQWETPPPPPGKLQTYLIYFLSAAGLQDCPVRGCRGRVDTRPDLFMQFLHRNL